MPESGHLDYVVIPHGTWLYSRGLLVEMQYSSIHSKRKMKQREKLNLKFHGGKAIQKS